MDMRAAIAQARLYGNGSTVDVMAPPDDEMEADERLCTDEDQGEVIVYHCDVLRMGWTSAYFCADCDHCNRPVPYGEA